MTRKKRKVADFPPEMLDAWGLAARGTLRLVFSSEGKATNFRQQMHAMRRAWAEENGASSIANWWDYDLEISNEQAETGEFSENWILKCGKIDWKEQVRHQVGIVNLPQPEIQNPASIFPAGITVASIVHPVALPPVAETVESALDKLGFKS